MYFIERLWEPVYGVAFVSSGTTWICIRSVCPPLSCSAHAPTSRDHSGIDVGSCNSLQQNRLVSYDWIDHYFAVVARPVPYLGMW